MSYAILTEHPEAASIKAQSWTAWSIWAKDNAPWTGVGLSEMASVLQRLREASDGHGLDQSILNTIDNGGVLHPAPAREVLRIAVSEFSPDVKGVFEFAVMNHDFGIRIDFTPSGLSASEFLEKLRALPEVQ